MSVPEEGLTPILLVRQKNKMNKSDQLHVESYINLPSIPTLSNLWFGEGGTYPCRHLVMVGSGKTTI